MKWASALICFVCVPTIVWAAWLTLRSRRQNPVLLKYRDINQLKPGCFKVGGSL